MLYALPELPEQTLAVPVMAPGVAGVVLMVIAFRLAAEVPHAFVAVTDAFPEVAPKVMVALVVP